MSFSPSTSIRLWCWVTFVVKCKSTHALHNSLEQSRHLEHASLLLGLMVWQISHGGIFNGRRLSITSVRLANRKLSGRRRTPPVGISVRLRQRGQVTWRLYKEYRERVFSESTCCCIQSVQNVCRHVSVFGLLYGSKHILQFRNWSLISCINLLLVAMASTENVIQKLLFQLAFWTLNLAHFCSSVVRKMEISLNIFHFLTSRIAASSWFMIECSIFYFDSTDRDWSFIILHLPIILISHKGSKSSSDKPNSGVTTSHSIYRNASYQRFLFQRYRRSLSF